MEFVNVHYYHNKSYPTNSVDYVKSRLYYTTVNYRKGDEK